MPHNKMDDSLENADVVYLQPSNLENIDFAVYEWVNEHLNVSVETHEGFKKVPVIWASAERSFQVKNNKELNDSDGALIFPLITVGRTGFVKDRTKKGAIYAPIPEVADYRGGAIKITKQINQNKTANFANADSFKKRSIRQVNFPKPKKKEKIVYSTVSIPIPVYVDVSYEIQLRSYYQQQMNNMITPFVSNAGGLNYVPLKRNGHFYEAFIQTDYATDNNIFSMGDDERTFQTKVDMKVLAYLIGDGTNEAQPFNVVRENPVQLRWTRERPSIGLKPENNDVTKKYRELGENPETLK
tara:strand:- start:3104 stop:4000 length:897 start_codon:yes stop_codon:yes gene_type:complete